MRFVGKESMWRFRWSAWLFDGMGGFPVHRSGADRQALRLCEAALRYGDPVVIFPEGTRKTGPAVTDLFEGAAFLATRTGAPIIPVGIGGSARAMPLGARYLRPGKVTVIVGRPLRPPPRPAGGRGVRRQVHELTDELQAELQRLFDLAEERALPRRRRGRRGG
jgi:1-acyl-sn-glycerol-3-phosphate acyltransferase